MKVSRSGKVFFYLFLLSIAIIPQIILADEYHYINSLIGERPAGMGGAYVAISDDPSGCYYNPAGIAFTTQRRLSVSVNAYHISTKTYQDTLIKTNGGTEDWQLESSRLLPNYFGIVHELGPGKIGFSYAVTDSVLRDQEQVYYNIRSALPGVDISRYVINIDDVDNTYNFGPSYALKVRDNLSIGTTLYIHYRDGKIIRNHLINLSNGEFNWENYYLSWTELGLRPIVGIMWSPVEKLSVGLTTSKTFLLSSERRIQTTLRGPSSMGYGLNDVDFIVYESEKKRRFPYQTALGIAYFPNPSFLIGGDISYYSKVSGRKDVVNLAIGTEYYTSPSFALRAGIFTDMANTPELSSSYTDQLEHINIYGVSVSGTYFTRTSSLTLGAIYSFGKGEAQVIPGSKDIQDAVINSTTIFIAAGYSY